MKQDKLIIKRAASSDAELLAEFASRVYADTFSAVNTPENMEAYLSTAFAPAQLQAELADPAASFFLAEVDGKLAGYAKLMAGQPPACVVGEAPVELVRFLYRPHLARNGFVGSVHGALFKRSQTARLPDDVSWRLGAQRPRSRLLSQMGLCACRRTHFSNGR